MQCNCPAHLAEGLAHAQSNRDTVMERRPVQQVTGHAADVEVYLRITWHQAPCGHGLEGRYVDQPVVQTGQHHRRDGQGLHRG